MTSDGWKPGLYAFITALVMFTLFFAIATVARAQELALDDIPQKELEGLPVKQYPEPGIIEGTWDWFISLFIDVEVQNVEIIKRSIVEQDLDITDVRLVRVNETVTREKTLTNDVWTTNPDCTSRMKAITPDDCFFVTQETTVVNETVLVEQYDVIVTPTQTYDVPQKTSCYEQGNEYVCESTLRCDGKPGIEYGCEYTKVSKQPRDDGSIVVKQLAPIPSREFVSRKDVITSPDKIVDAELTMHLDESVVDAVKTVLVRSIDEGVAVE